MSKMNLVFCMLLLIGCASESPYLSGVYTFPVIGKSMEPTLPFGSEYVLDSDARFEDVKVGQIVVYWNGKKLVAHRTNGFTTRGDNNKRNDVWPVTKANFRGLVILSE